MKDDNYYVVQGWMVNRLGLKGNALIVYAVLYGFTQDGNSCYDGTLGYLSSACGASKATCKRALKELEELGHIEKFSSHKNNITMNSYRCLPPGVKMTPPPVQNDPGSEVKMTPYNKNSNNYIDNNNPPSLFPGSEIDKKKKCLLRNSDLTFEILKSELSAPEFSEVDLRFYYESIKDWSDSADKKRNFNGWIATIRNAMRKDAAKGKLKKVSKQEDAGDAIEFLSR